MCAKILNRNDDDDDDVARCFCGRNGPFHSASFNYDESKYDSNGDRIGLLPQNGHDDDGDDGRDGDDSDRDNNENIDRMIENNENGYNNGEILIQNYNEDEIAVAQMLVEMGQQLANTLSVDSTMQQIATVPVEPTVQTATVATKAAAIRLKTSSSMDDPIMQIETSTKRKMSQ